MLKNMAVIIFLCSQLLSCGGYQSASSIMSADVAKHKALRLIVTEFKDETLSVKDEFGNESLDPNAAEKIMPLERRECVYYYFLAEAYLDKARDLQSKSEHERARDLAVKAAQYADMVEKSILEPVKKDEAPIQQQKQKQQTSPQKQEKKAQQQNTIQGGGK